MLTRPRVAGFNARDAVAACTPAATATSRKVGVDTDVSLDPRRSTRAALAGRQQIADAWLQSIAQVDLTWRLLVEALIGGNPPLLAATIGIRDSHHRKFAEIVDTDTA